MQHRKYARVYKMYRKRGVEEDRPRAVLVEWTLGCELNVEFPSYCQANRESARRETKQV